MKLSESNVPSEVLPPPAVRFLHELHSRFENKRVELLVARAERARLISKGQKPIFIPETVQIRNSQWRVAPVPQDLQDRRVEITGPAEAKMLINALNSGAKVFMADLEDSLSPTWKNILEAQFYLKQAVRKTLSYKSAEGKEYKLRDNLATLIVRPRGWHLTEDNFIFDGRSMSASLFDFGLYAFHNATELLSRGSGPYFYLPKMESHLEARLWNEVFDFTEDYLGIPHGSIKATVLIETILAAFEMDEILFELKDHIVGLNAGRWDYLFSMIKKFAQDPATDFPDRSQLTMTLPFMRAYTQLLVQTCHKRGAHAIGGMAAFIPSRKDAAINEIAFKKVREDKMREAGDGFDGTWVAHPDLVLVAQEVFDKYLGSNPHQKNKIDVAEFKAQDLLPKPVEGGARTLEGVRNNVEVSLLYIYHWLRGLGAVAIHNLMEDAATAEISRAQLWHWIHHKAPLKDGEIITPAYFKILLNEEVEKIKTDDARYVQEAKEILERLVLDTEFADFLTLPAYKTLNSNQMGEKWNQQNNFPNPGLLNFVGKESNGLTQPQK